MKISIKKLLIILMTGMVLIAGLLIMNHSSQVKEHVSKSSASPSVTTVAATTTPVSTTSSVPVVTPEIPLSYAASVQPDNTTQFHSSWALQASDGISTSIQSDYISNIISIGSQSNMNDVHLYRDSFPLLNGSTYTVSFQASSENSRTINFSITDANTGNSILSKDCNLSSSPQKFNFEITPETNYYNTSLNFYVGGKPDNIHISDIRLSNNNVGNATHDIRVNQVSYSSDDIKRCTFSHQEGDFFDLMNQDTGEIVYTGALLNPVNDNATGETNTCYGDFSKITAEGTYYIRSQTGDVSYPFTISRHPYTNLQKSLTHMLSLQRCGMDLDQSWAGDFAHGYCHSQWPWIYGSSESRYSPGGWHDAADFGRYVTTGSKAVSDLLIAYLMNPDVFTDDTNSAQSGNGIPDILDEARYELEWMSTMQNADGSVYARILTTNVSGAADPSTDNQQMYFIGIDTQSTADCMAVMELASVIWKDLDPDFASACSKAAEHAYNYLSANASRATARNPADINGGVYNDDYDMDERFYAYAAAYYATSDLKYLDNAKTEYYMNPDKITGTGWREIGAFGKYLITVSNAQSDDPEFFTLIKNSLIEEADQILQLIDMGNYGVSIYEYNWGSNGYVLNNGELLMMAYHITDDQKYRQGAVQQVDYVLGRNSLNMSFVTTYGTVYPHHVHQYASNALGIVYPGALVGGPNSDREDTVTYYSLPADTPVAKYYSDSFASYSTNEISVYWNSAFIALTGMLS